LLIKQNYFGFKGKIYTKQKGLAMGAPTTSILSEIFLQFLENTRLYDILQTSKAEGYFIFVDDIYVYKENKTHIYEILNRFNRAASGLSFTLELENNNKINLLDLTLIREENRWHIDLYRKPTATDVIIPQDSCHPLETRTEN
jgi:hypothetical protein